MVRFSVMVGCGNFSKYCYLPVVTNSRADHERESFCRRLDILAFATSCTLQLHKPLVRASYIYQGRIKIRRPRLVNCPAWLCELCPFPASYERAPPPSVRTILWFSRRFDPHSFKSSKNLVDLTEKAEQSLGHPTLSSLMTQKPQ